jgi:hypothetical protein
MVNAVLINVEHVHLDFIYAIIVIELIIDIKARMISVCVKMDLLIYIISMLASLATLNV